MTIKLCIPLILIFLTSCKPSVEYKDTSKKVTSGASEPEGANRTGSQDGNTDTPTPTPDPESSTNPATVGSTSTQNSGPIITSPTTTIIAAQPTPAPNITVQSSDNNLTYSWTTISGPSTLTFKPTNVKQPDISASVDGEYVARLTVADTSGATATQDFTFTWDTSPPVITMPANLRVTGPIKIQGTTVTDLSKNISLQWRLILPTSDLTFSDATTIEPTANPAKDGIYLVELKASDPLGHTSTGYMTIERYAQPSGSDPVVTMGPGLTINTPSRPTGITATSTDPNLKYSWSTTSGPAQLTFQNAIDLMPIISAPQDGIYVATLSVSDSQKRTAIRSLVIIWDTTPPTIVAASPMNINKPTQPTVTVTDQSLVVTYKWEQVSGPGVISFSNTAILNPFIAASVAGAYSIKLSATDIAGNQSTKTITVNWSVPDLLAPVITLGAPLTIYQPTAPTGVQVVDADTKITIHWDQAAGPGHLAFSNPDILTPLISADKIGDYIARITATDSSGNRAEAFLPISWISGDKTPPTITMSDNMTISQPTPPAAVTVSDASPVTLKWTQVSGPGTLLFSDTTIAKPVISATVPGTYIARLTATDSAGNQTAKDLVIVWQVFDADAPVLTMGPPMKIAIPTQPTGVSAQDSDTNLTYLWTQINGPGILSFSNPGILQPSIAANTPGSYVASLTVKDSRGNMSVGLLVINWYIPDQTSPILVMGPNLKIKQTTLLSQVKATDNDSALTFQWTKLSGPGSVNFSSANDLNPTVSMSQDGTYVLQLVAQDTSGNKATGSLQIIWDNTPPKVYAGADRTEHQTFTIQDSSVTDTTPVTYNWRIISKPSAASITFSNIGILHPQVTANYPGNYVLELTAIDAMNVSASSSFKLTYNAGVWTPADRSNCSTICRNAGKANVRSPEGAYCTSGENVLASAVPWVVYKYGCWPNCTPTTVNNAESVNNDCYKPDQRRDSDRTDMTVGCFCN